MLLTASTIAQTDSLTTISTNKLRFFVGCFYKQKALEKDTAFLLSEIKEYKHQIDLHKSEEANLKAISTQKDSQIFLLQKQISVDDGAIVKLSKRNVFLKRFTFVITPITFIGGGILSYKLFH